MRDHGMFGFLMEGSGRKTNEDLSVLKEFAKEAATGFLGKDRVPLNHTIQKTAKVENLTPDQISIICQEANKAVHGHMFKTAENKYVDFEIADAGVIVSNLEEKLSKTASVNKTTPAGIFMSELEVEKVASAGIQEMDDFSLAPGEKSNITSDFSFTKQAGHDGLKIPQSHMNKVAFEKKAQELQNIKDEYIVVQSQLEGAEKNFVKEARNMLMPYPMRERSDKYSLIAGFCKQAGMSSGQIKKMASLTEIVMKKQGLLEKSASLKADEQYISDNLDARVINGDHAMLIHVKTVVDKEERKEALKNKHNLIKTEMETYMSGEPNGAVLGQKVKEL